MLSTLQGAVSGSVQASDRLMKELREIYRSQSYKTGRIFRSTLPVGDGGSGGYSALVCCRLARAL